MVTYRDIPVTDVMEILRYDSISGRLTWCFRDRRLFKTERQFKTWNARFSGRDALSSLSQRGYLHGKIFGLACKAHHAAWAIYHGNWPDGEVDHIDRDKANNSIDNLRIVDRSQNCMNRSGHKDSTSKYKGVSYKKSIGKWTSQIQHNKQSIHLGYYNNELDAAEAYDNSMVKYHGDFGVSNGTV